MKENLPVLYIARHGETAWSLSGQHTGLTDIALTEKGEESAKLLGQRLGDLKIDKVYTSPLQRAARTCELAGFGSLAEVDRDLVEWDYGKYEGITSKQIHEIAPDWQLFRDGCPGGESPEQVSLRADRFIERARSSSSNVLIFTSGHISRVLALRWIGIELATAKNFLMLSTASLSALSYEHNVNRPVISLWNETRHLDK